MGIDPASRIPASTRRSTQKSRSGRPAIGNQAFGDRVGKRAEPRTQPAGQQQCLDASVTHRHGMGSPPGLASVLDEDVPAAVPGDPEGELARPSGPRGWPGGARGGHQEEEASPAGAQQLASRGPRLTGRLVQVVDAFRADPVAE